MVFGKVVKGKEVLHKLVDYHLNNGITNGWDWYEVNGGRQDYMNYFKYCREITLELSDDKTPNPNDLPMFWDANYPSFINYMEQSLYGIRGIITDSISGIPIKAKVEIFGHYIVSSHVYSSLPIGNYHRYLYQGNHTITFSKAGYYSKTINASVLNNSTTVQDVQLVPFGFVGIDNVNDQTVYINAIPNPAKNSLKFDYFIPP